MVVGRERIGAEPDLTDLVARRQPSAAEAVHLEHARLTPPAMLRQHVRRARLDLRAAPRSPTASSVVLIELPRRSSVAVVSLTTTSSCRPSIFSVDVLIVRAAPQLERCLERQEAGNSTCNFALPDGSVRRRREPAFVARERHGIAGGRRDDDGGVRNTGAGLIDDDEAKLRQIGVLRVERQREKARREPTGTVSFLVKVFPLKFGLIW